MSILTEISTDEARDSFEGLRELRDTLMDRAFKFLELRNPNSRLSYLPGSNVIYSNLYRVNVLNLEGLLFNNDEHVVFGVETLHSPNVPIKTFSINRHYALTNDVHLYIQSGGVID